MNIKTLLLAQENKIITDLLLKVCEQLYTDQNETFEDTCTAISSVKGLKEWWDKQ